MRRPYRWEFSPGETRDLGVSMADELDAGVVMTGSTPTVTAYTRSGSRGRYSYSAASGFTFSGVQVNDSQITAADGEVVAIGEAILFRCTAPTTQGTYYIVTECDADDGTHPVREDEILVSGAGAA